MTPRVLSIILLVLAVCCAAVFTLFGFDRITTDYPYGWLGLAVAFFAASFVVEK